MPAETGIVELTLYWNKGRGPALVAPTRRPTFRAMLATVDPPPKPLTTPLKRLTAR
jgi:hypothetical protein